MTRTFVIQPAEQRLPISLWPQPSPGRTRKQANNRTRPNGTGWCFLAVWRRLSRNTCVRVHRSMLKAACKPENGRIRKAMIVIPPRSWPVRCRCWAAGVAVAARTWIRRRTAARRGPAITGRMPHRRPKILWMTTSRSEAFPLSNTDKPLRASRSRGLSFVLKSKNFPQIQLFLRSRFECLHQFLLGSGRHRIIVAEAYAVTPNSTGDRLECGLIGTQFTQRHYAAG